MKIKQSDMLIRKLFLSLIPIQALSVGLPAINSLITTFIIGNFIGTDGLAALGFTVPLLLLVRTVATTLADGSQLLSGHYMGEGSRDGLCRAFSSTLISAVLLSLPLTLICVFFPEFTVRLLGAEGSCFENTVEYVRGYGIGITFSVLASCILPFLQLARAERTSSLCVGVMVAVNIAFNLLNVFVLHWGMFGAGLAVTAANICMLLASVPYFAFRCRIFRFSFRSFDVSVLKNIIYRGFPAALNPVCIMLRNRVMNSFLFDLGGTVAISAVTIANNFSDVIGIVVSGGYAGSGCMVASVLTGEKDNDSLTRLSHVMVRSAGWILMLGYAVTFIFARPLSLLLGAEPEHIGIYVMAVRLFNLWFISTIWQTPPMRIYQAAGYVKLVSILYVLNCFVYPVGLCLMLGRSLGLPLVMSLPWLAELMTVLTIAVYYAVRSGHLPASPSDLCYLPEGLSSQPDDVFTASARSVEDTVNISESARHFCISKGMDARSSYFCALCVEEIVANVVLHGFTKDRKKDHSVDVRISCEGGRLLLLFRDNCVHFDPNEWLALSAGDDPMRGIGIRMVKAMAGEINYNSSLGLNVLMIEL